MEKQPAARLLYEQGLSGKDIARLLNVSEQTVINWKKKYGWEAARQKKTLAKATAEEAVWELINYQLAALKTMKEAWQRDAPDKPRLLDKGDIDALTKLFSAIKGKPLEWGNYVAVVRELVAYLQTRDHALALQVIDLSDGFLNEKRKTL